MIGEIRDEETAQIAFRAAHTGHLVLSSLHTNSAIETIVRCIHLGIRPDLMAYSFKLMVAQRLLRRLCKHCKQLDTHAHVQLEQLGQRHFCHHSFYKPVGCTLCHQGYKGRFAVFELLEMSTSLLHILLHADPITQLQNNRLSTDHCTLLDAAIQYAIQGETSLDEIQRVICWSTT